MDEGYCQMSTPRMSVMQDLTFLELCVPWIVLYTEVRVVPHSLATRYTDQPFKESRRLTVSTGGNSSAAWIACSRAVLSVSIWNLDFSKGSCRVRNLGQKIRSQVSECNYVVCPSNDRPCQRRAWLFALCSNCVKVLPVQLNWFIFWVVGGVINPYLSGRLLVREFPGFDVVGKLHGGSVAVTTSKVNRLD